MPSARNIRPLVGVDMQLWSSTGAVGSPAASSGTMTYEDRSPGLYRFQVRGLPVQNGTRKDMTT
ncbi:hypothetical protein ccbrp13_17350 [Ktedonobacteria bacterium brp13]|nr:hypothetical protein ccbrp13_17350 [Ktedonobacteria bacterium brp13]